MRDVFFQFFHPLQGCILGFSILQQSSHIKDIVQVSLNLHLQLVTLSVLQLLKNPNTRQDSVSISVKTEHNYPMAYMFLFVSNSLVFSKREYEISSSFRELWNNYLRGTIRLLLVSSLNIYTFLP